MSDVVIALWAVFALIAVGYLVARTGVTGPGADRALSKLTFHAFIPALMFHTVSRTEPHEVFSPSALVTVLTSSILVALFLAYGKLRNMRGSELTIATLCSSYVNAGNIGIAYLVAITGEITLAASIMMFQLCVMVPITFVVLDKQTGHRHATRIGGLVSPFRQPPVLGVFAGLAVSIADVDVPAFIEQPVSMLSEAAIPLMLVTLGISFHGQPRLNLTTLSYLGPITVMKMILGPVIAYLLGLAFSLDGWELCTVTLAGAFPTANNVFVYAAKYNTGMKIARESILVTTLVSLPVILLIAVLIRP